MHTEFSPEQLTNPDFAHSNEILVRCLQCGYCLDNCPTYQQTGAEEDTPRGRVLLIKEMLESNSKPEASTVYHIDRCLHCLTCLSTCPSFVNYMHLVDHAREHIEQHYTRPLLDRLYRSTLAHILPYPKRLRWAIRGAQLVKPLAALFSGRLRRLVEAAPDTLGPVSDNDRAQVFPALGKRTHRVALLTGCVQKAVNSDINEATIRLLRRHGCEVVIAQDTGCCGALTHHMGKLQDSRQKAINNTRAWMREMNGEGLDAIVVNTSGCGTVVKDYGHILRNHNLAPAAEIIASITRDISELLLELKLEYQLKPELRVAYHASCSLQFGQRIRFAPKKLLKAAGFIVLEPKNQHSCCGSGGTYSLLQPELSAQLQKEKVEALEKNDPDLIAAGNIGCMMQIAAGSSRPVVHTVELLDWVTGGPQPRALSHVL